MYYNRVIWLLIMVLFPVLLHADVRLAGIPSLLAGGEEQIRMAPQWSPDGRLIAYTSAHYRGIWVIDVNSSAIQQISDEDGAGFGFVWSSDSRAILARVAKFEDRRRLNAIKIFDLEAGTEEQICDYTTRFLSLPRFESRGTKVVYFDKNDLQIAHSQRKAADLQKPLPIYPVPLLHFDRLVLWHPEDDRLEPLALPVGDQFLNPVLSPNGRLLAYEVYGGNLCVYDLQEETCIDLGVGYQPAWSPDSRYLVYTLALDDGHEYTSADLYIVSIDGKERLQITDTPDRLEMNAAWSPDGSTIVCDDIDRGELMLIPVKVTD